MNAFKMLMLALIVASCATNAQNTRAVSDESAAPAPLYVQLLNSEISRNPDPRLLEFREKPKWEYTHGLMCLATFRVWQHTEDPQYLDYVKYYADSMINEDGSILTYKLSDYNIDRINPGKLLLELNKVSPQPKYEKAIALLRKQMSEQPRTSEGGFWHKKRYPYQMWLDGLYMGSPFLTQYANDYSEPRLYDDVTKQIILMDKHTYSEKTGLYYHAWDESKKEKWSNKETGQSPHFWGRAMGWYSMALVDILDYLPENHPNRDKVLEIADKVASGIARYQDAETGVWWQILDKGDQEGNYLEASCSSMFSYFLLKGVNKGYLAESYRPIAKKAYEGVVKQFFVENEDGTVSLTKICAVAGLGGSPYRDGSYEYYIGEPQRDNDPKGVGPFIMAGIQYESMTN
jgi:unsaturated rhamnogalacturonyl hydrolase